MRSALLLLGLPGMLVFAAATADSAAMGALPPLSGLILPAIVILVLIALNGLYVASEFAIVAVRPTQVEPRAEAGDTAAALVLSIRNTPREQDRYIATAQLGITLASLGLGMYGEAEIAHFIEPWINHLLPVPLDDTALALVGYIVAVSLLTYLHVVVGEMVPKSLALFDPERAALTLVWPMRLSQFILGIPVLLLNTVGVGLMRLLGIPPISHSDRVHSPAEIEHIAAESEQGGLLAAQEGELIRNIMDFSERYVAHVMTPRRKVEALAVNTPLAEALDFVTHSTHSRFPVYADTLDNVVGVVHVKDLLRFVDRPAEHFDLRLLARPVPIVPESYPLEDMLAVFRQRHTHLAIVLDEYAGTAGIVTLEDIVEEIMGEVRDEFDVERDEIIQLGPGRYDVAGSTLLLDLRDVAIPLGDPADLPDVDTLGGLILARLGRPAILGDLLTLPSGLKLTVTALDGRAVARARLEFTPPEAT